TVFLDTNNNGVPDTGEPSTSTDANGNYSFSNLATGIYRVREVVPSGFVPTTSNPVVVTASGGNPITGINFGNVLASTSLSGQAFNDLNNNGLPDPGEPGLSGVTLFLDLNSNGVFDSGEPSRITDGNGNYSFTNLAAGTYRVREVV